jgi:AIPR protein/Abortive infection phage resistance protein N-terminal domain
MDSQQFYEELMNNVRARAELDSDFTESAFLQEVTERLVDAEELGYLTPVHFTGTGYRNRRLAVSAYDMEESDDSVALAVIQFQDGSHVSTLSETEVKRQFAAAQHYIEESLSGAFQVGREESNEEYELAETLRRRGRSVTRYRLYLLTNKALSARAKDFPSSNVDGIPIEFHVWDIGRFRRVHESTLGHEELIIDLTEWVPTGIPALNASALDSATTTYLCVLPARLIADLYGRYGGRLLQSNVRSYLSNRGKVNRGIRETVMAKPELFLAYNNGITATAIEVELTGSSITKVRDLQIVNGGQTTASLFYAQRDSKRAAQFDEAHIQAKLVVVSPDLAQELVPNISRFANSQNKVSEADFFSNSPFHVRLEELSRRILTPTRPGVTYQSKWFYERTRGQYANEKAKLGRLAEEKKFAATFPRAQVITKTDAAKYAVSWARKPHLVSAGAQKNFVAFAEDVAGRWESSSDSINESYFKDLVAQAILYNSIRAAVSKQPWYQSGYLANIVTYTIAKISHAIAKAGRGKFDFDAVWQRQGISEATRNCALEVAERVLQVLTSEQRPVANVTEWAKREQCWATVQELPIALPNDLIDELVSGDEVRSIKKTARIQQRVDDGIQLQAAALAVPRDEWLAIQRFAVQRRLLSPVEAGILELVTRPNPGIPSERQAARLMELRQRVAANGYDHEKR